jgi:septal ring factor EnvC (AmiA/AmiB activator)
MRPLIPLLLMATIWLTLPGRPWAEAPAARGDMSAPRTGPGTQRLERLRQELVRLGRAQRAGDRTSDAWRDRLMELNQRQADLDRRMGTNRDSLVRMLGALQMFRRDPPPSLLVNPRSARDAVRAAILIRAVLPELEARRRAYVEEANELNRIRRDAAVAGAALLSAESADAERRARIDQLVAAKSTLEISADPDAARRTSAAAARAGSTEELVGNLTHADPAVAPAHGSLEGITDLRLEPPVHGKLVRRFGGAIQRTGEDRRRSTGVAWRTAAAATVLSPADGVVDYAGPIKGAGLVVIVRLKGDFRLVLAGLDRVTATTGSQLVSGEPVGQMPQVSGPELLLEIRRGAQPVNPANWLKL